MKSIDQGEVKRIWELLATANNHNYALIPELAKEVGIKKTEMMQYVIDNPKLFHTENIWSYKEVKIKRRFWANDPKSVYTDTKWEKNRNLGLGVKGVYLSAVENYRTDEWLQHQIVSAAKYLHITESNNYGYIQGYYVQVDTERDNDPYRMHLWRNTGSKLKKLRETGYLSKTSFCYGGLGDSYTAEYENGISVDKISELTQLGWTFNNFSPLSK